MAVEATPRINARYLEQFSHQTVRIVGKVVSLRGEVASLEADGSVVVHLNRVSPYYLYSNIKDPVPGFNALSPSSRFHLAITYLSTPHFLLSRILCRSHANLMCIRRHT